MPEETNSKVVYFSATWCGPCKTFKPRVEDVAKSRDDAEFVFVDIDTDEGKEKVAEYGVKSVPTVIGINGSEEVSRFVGSKSSEELNKFIDELVGHHGA